MTEYAGLPVEVAVFQIMTADRNGHIAWAVDVSNMKLASNPERSNVR
jgi:hypothetical protein